jgi:hypothetical protein
MAVSVKLASANPAADCSLKPAGLAAPPTAYFVSNPGVIGTSPPVHSLKEETSSVIVAVTAAMAMPL